LIAEYGADGVRVAMMLCSSAGNDLMFDNALCEQGRNFGNKIWNAYRLINGWSVDENLAQSSNNAAAVAWFRAKMNAALTEIEDNFNSYRISEALMVAYKLFWDDFSGWYLEIVKPAYGAPIDKCTIEQTKLFFEQLMLVLHPFMPFVTEEIWQDLAPRAAGESIMTSPMPKAEPVDEQLLARFALLQEAVSAIRNVRKQKNIPQKEAVELKVVLDENYPQQFEAVLVKMGNLSAITPVTEKSNPTDAGFIVKTTQYFIPMGDNINLEEEIAKLEKDLAYYEGFLASVMKKLSNERFVTSAPAQVVANERAKQADAEAKIAAIREQLTSLK
jgi:valyl-tRNA synthetase